MKNATKYEPKIKKLLAGAKSPRVEPPDDDDDVDVDVVEVLLRGILQADALDAQAEEALELLQEELVDLNELRVAQPKEIVEIIGKEYPLARRKAEAIRAVLQGVYDRASAVDVAYMVEMPKRELRRHLTELGMDRYAAAYDTLAGCLEMDGYLEPDATGEEAQGFLERVIQQKHAHAAHEALRGFAAKRGKALARKRQAQAEAARKVAEKARKVAEAAAEAARKVAEEEEAKKKAAQKEVAKKRAAARRAAAKKKAPKKAPARKPAARKATKKAPAKKAAKPGKKAPPKAAARKTSKKTGKNTPARRSGKKS
jgi:hypothetical protein